MKVLAICQEDPSEILGGMGMHIRELYREMASMGVEIDLLTQGKPEGAVDYLGFTKHYDDKHICFKPTKPDFACRLMVDIQMAKTLMRLIAERGADYWDVIHQHEWTSVQLARMARRALSLPLVGTMHLCLSRLAFVENPSTNPGKWGQADLYMMQQEGHLVCDPDEFILCSDSYVEMAREHFGTDRPINMVHNGVNTSEWNPEAGDGERARYEHNLDFVSGRPHRRPVALFVGRVAEMKGIVYLLEAVEKVDMDWQVVIAGEVNANDEKSKEEWWVTHKMRKLEDAYPERFRWVGFQHGQDLRDLYAAADCVLMPSTHEPFGIVALEAMAMGAPLIATEVDGLGEIVCDGDDEYAMIIPERSVDAIVAALRVLKKNPDVREELRELGLKRVRDFTWAQAAESTLEIYRRAMGHGRVRALEENKCRLH